DRPPVPSRYSRKPPPWQARPALPRRGLAGTPPAGTPRPCYRPATFRTERGAASMKVAVIGLGTMGMGAALNLHKKGHAVTGCDVRESARAEFAAAGARAAASPAELPADLEAVVVFVVNAAQTEAVLFGPHGCLDRLRPGTVVLCCATVAPEAARALGQRIAEAGFLMLD